MKFSNKIFILSAERSDLDWIENVQRTASMEADLRKLGYRYQSVEGRYKGITEHSFLVSEAANEDLEASLKALAADYQQESILRRDVSGSTVLLFPDGGELYIGEWRQVPQYVAETHENYTYSPLNDGYYVTVNHERGE